MSLGNLRGEGLGQSGAIGGEWTTRRVLGIYIILLPTFEAALAGEISYGTNMSVPRVAYIGLGGVSELLDLMFDFTLHWIRGCSA